jgi:methionyl-tRNA formyltransferase
LENKKDMTADTFKIVFMGTPDFAVHILDGLFTEEFSIVGVVTAPDKPAGRGQQIQQSAVKKYAVENDLHILQPTNLKSPEFIEELEALQADLFVVVAFRMLPEVVWSMPPKGTINLHASLLPNYRGAAPINRAIMNGEKETGVTTFFIEKEIDTGKVIEREAIPIGENETAGELHDRLMELGRTLTINTVHKIKNGHAEAIDQLSIQEGDLKNAPKIFRDDCRINWHTSVDGVHNFIRGLSPYPAAHTILTNEKGETKSFKLFKGIRTSTRVDLQSSLKNDPNGILFPCSDYYYCVTELQPEGKRKMNFKEFLAGNRAEDWRLEA